MHVTLTHCDRLPTVLGKCSFLTERLCGSQLRPGAPPISRQRGGSGWEVRTDATRS